MPTQTHLKKLSEEATRQLKSIESGVINLTQLQALLIEIASLDDSPGTIETNNKIKDPIRKLRSQLFKGL